MLTPRQLSLWIAYNNATDIKLHVHTYAVVVADIAACEGLPHNVLHSPSIMTTLIEKAHVVLSAVSS